MQPERGGSGVPVGCDPIFISSQLGLRVSVFSALHLRRVNGLDRDTPIPPRQHPRIEELALFLLSDRLAHHRCDSSVSHGRWRASRKQQSHRGPPGLDG